MVLRQPFASGAGNSSPQQAHLIETTKDEVSNMQVFLSNKNTGHGRSAKCVNRTCKCGKEFIARLADVKRGWGNSCSKRCAALFRTKTNTINTTKQIKIKKSIRQRAQDILDGDWDDFDPSWDAHKECF